MNVIKFKDVEINQKFGMSYEEIETGDEWSNVFIKINTNEAVALDCDEVICIENFDSICWVDDNFKLKYLSVEGQFEID